LQSFEFEPTDRGGMGHVARPNTKFDMLGLAIAVSALAYVDGYEKWVRLYGQHVDEWRAWKTHALRTIRKGIPSLS
jgi:hypothetical protein